MEMCKEFGVLPEPGGLMDQPIWFIRMRAVLHATPDVREPDPLAAFAMEIG